MTDPKRSFDVAILGWWYGKNYGSILTYYGLNRAIESLGRSVLMVHEPLGYNGFRVDWPDDILSMEFARRIGYQYTEQEHFSELPKLNESARTFVVGSDQLWNPLIGRVNDDLFLDFVSEENQRVAYATSFGNRGTAKFKPEFVDKHSKNLRAFKAISVREGYAIDTARDIFGAAAELVVDPVFLLPREHYEELASKATISPEGDYLAVFLLDPTPEKKAVVTSIADKLGFDKILVIPNPDGGREHVSDVFADEPRAEIIGEDAPENFLRAYRDASYVVTDSFHGSAFSAIFEKPFSSLYNEKRGADRFKNLLASLGFDDTRRVYETDDAAKIAQNPNVTREIDFATARTYIAAGRESSMAWLKSALDPEVKGSAAIPGAAKHSFEEGPVEEVALGFSSNSPAWTVEPREGGVHLRVARDGAVRGNLAWTDLGVGLEEGAVYRMKIDWTPTTTVATVNLHLRNPETRTFRVVGKAAIADGGGKPRIDDVVFRVPESGLSQFMLGALHFAGEGSGADIRSISLQKLRADHAVPAPASAAKKTGGIVARFAKEARALALHDADQQVKAFERARSADDFTGARARMFFHAHAIEKGLTHSNFRPGFGRIAVPGIAKEMNSWLAAGRGVDDTIVQSSASVMKAYFERNAETEADVSHFWNLFSESAQSLINTGIVGEGGVLPASLERETPIVTPDDDRSFMNVMYGRRSVREFTNQPVDNATIASAVEIAMQAPSVCSRQGSRVHQFDDPATIQQLLDVQGGFAGFKTPPRLLLVTADLDAFLFAPERNQPFVDGGLFMMSLLLGLTQMNLGSCLLNTAMGTGKEGKIRSLVDIPDNEVFIAFVAVGHYDEKVLVPRSKRFDATGILKRHTAA